jgi:hypothetical protein
MNTVGSQVRLTPEEEGLTVEDLDGVDAILRDENGHRMLYTMCDDFAGSVVVIQGIGYEFVREIQAEKSIA